MNARFRIGNTYQFTIDSDKVSISSNVLEYTGFSFGRYQFEDTLSGFTQSCPKKWIEDKEVGVINEWGKDGSLLIRE